MTQSSSESSLFQTLPNTDMSCVWVCEGLDVTQWSSESSLLQIIPKTDLLDMVVVIRGKGVLKVDFGFFWKEL